MTCIGTETSFGSFFVIPEMTNLMVGLALWVGLTLSISDTIHYCVTMDHLTLTVSEA